MDSYIWYYYNNIDINHTNKWQNNYYDTDGEYNHSTFLGDEGFKYGAPYGYGVKDDLQTLENKIYGDGYIYDLGSTEDQNITLSPGISGPDSVDNIVITSTCYLENDLLTLVVDVANPYVDW
jgi:hypothetical protein